MNNLHRELAPISDMAWAQIEEEASRTLKRHLAARRVVAVRGPKGFEFAAVGTGHLRQITAQSEPIQAAIRKAKTLVELRVPFELTRQAIDNVERGAMNSDWSPLKDAARKNRLGRGSCCLRRVRPRSDSRYLSGYQQPAADAPCGCEELSRYSCAGGEPIAPRRGQRPPISSSWAQNRTLHSAERAIMATQS